MLSAIALVVITALTAPVLFVAAMPPREFWLRPTRRTVRVTQTTKGAY